MKRRSFSFSLLALLLGSGIPLVTQAGQYIDVNPVASTLSFTYLRAGAKMYGTFSKFVASMNFDTAHVQASSLKLVITLDSVHSDDQYAGDELVKPGWFNTPAYPLATFASTQIKDLGEQRYTVLGDLTLKGVTRQVAVPVLLKADGSVGIFEGNLTVDRRDYAIGVGEWTDSMISNEIDIRFRMVAPER